MKELEFLREKFSSYYRSKKLQFPSRFTHREFAFVYWSTDFMDRHRGFGTRQQIHNFLCKKVPQHVYYSSAYYRKPNAPTMEEKLWLGADLIFDLDADHLSDVKNLSYEQMLGRVKEESCKLLYDFLLSDFGVEEKEIKINFSGARGYHVHVRSNRALKLDTYARREIIDYIEGEGLAVEQLLCRRVIGVGGRGRYRRPIYRFELPAPEEPGWGGKIRKSIQRLLTRLERLERGERIKYLRTSGIGKKRATEIHEALFERGGADKVRQGVLEVFSQDKYRDPFLELAKRECRIEFRGEADEPVTSDTKRLIRMVTSLHGKTGFEVKPIKLNELEEFNPLRDAIAFTDEPVWAEIIKPMRLQISEEKFNLKEGSTEVPEYLAVFLLAQGAAKLLE